MAKVTVKPIFVVKIPNIYSMSRVRELIDSIESEKNKGIKALKEDYHILVVEGQEVKEITFECFNVTDVDEIKFTAFKKLINKK